jgi:hypothetical protein
MGIPQAGSLDAQAVGCVPEEFRDHLHSRLSCLQKVFQHGVLQNLPEAVKPAPARTNRQRAGSIRDAV